jgi:hypothetical protein
MRGPHPAAFGFACTTSTRILMTDLRNAASMDVRRFLRVPPFHDQAPDFVRFLEIFRSGPRQQIPVFLQFRSNIGRIGDDSPFAGVDRKRLMVLPELHRLPDETLQAVMLD